MFPSQVTQIARFLLERGLHFRNLGFCGHDLMRTATFNAPVPIYPEGPAFNMDGAWSDLHISAFLAPLWASATDASAMP
jgi:hypothetical protein